GGRLRRDARWPRRSRQARESRALAAASARPSEGLRVRSALLRAQPEDRLVVARRLVSRVLVRLRDVVRVRQPLSRPRTRHPDAPSDRRSLLRGDLMQALLDAVVDLVALVSPAKVRTVASALRGLASPGLAPAANTLADTPAARTAVARVVAAWTQVQVGGDEVAGMRLGAAEARQRVERELSVELVWTGPTTRFVPTRRTEQVHLDLIASAHTDLFLVSFVAYDVYSFVTAMNEAARRGVRLRVLIEASKEHGGTLDKDLVPKMRASIPMAELFSWKARAESFVDGKVHAKVAVVDGTRAFITSANLTGHALEKNMEAGVLITGGVVPRALSDHLQALVDVGILERA